jgi:hypothetical protein
MIDEKHSGWSIYDIMGNAIRDFRDRIEGDGSEAFEPAIFVCYRKRHDLRTRVHCSGFNITIAYDRHMSNDNELYAFYPGRQYLLAYWKNGQTPGAANRFPIRIANLEEATMPLEPIYDDEGNEAGWKMRPIEDQKAKVQEKADEKVAKTEEKAETKLQKLEEKAKPAATPTKTA